MQKLENLVLKLEKYYQDKPKGTNKREIKMMWNEWSRKKLIIVERISWRAVSLKRPLKWLNMNLKKEKKTHLMSLKTEKKN